MHALVHDSTHAGFRSEPTARLHSRSLPAWTCKDQHQPSALSTSALPTYAAIQCALCNFCRNNLLIANFIAWMLSGSKPNFHLTLILHSSQHLQSHMYMPLSTCKGTCFPLSGTPTQLLAFLTFSPVGRPWNSGVSLAAGMALTQVSTVKPLARDTTFSPCSFSITYFLLHRRGNAVLVMLQWYYLPQLAGM